MPTGPRKIERTITGGPDGDQDVSKWNAMATGLPSEDDFGDPRPITGELLSARHLGLMFLHWDKTVLDRRDDRRGDAAVHLR